MALSTNAIGAQQAANRARVDARPKPALTTEQAQMLGRPQQQSIPKPNYNPLGPGPFRPPGAPSTPMTRPGQVPSAPGGLPPRGTTTPPPSLIALMPPPSPTTPTSRPPARARRSLARRRSSSAMQAPARSGASGCGSGPTEASGAGSAP